MRNVYRNCLHGNLLTQGNFPAAVPAKYSRVVSLSLLGAAQIPLSSLENSIIWYGT